MAEIGGGWLSDFDTLPTFLDPEFGLPNGGNFTCYQTFIPGLLSGSGSEWRRMAYEVVNKASKDPELRKEGSRHLVCSWENLNLLLPSASLV